MKEETFQTMIRKTTFDSGHRVMNEKMKCFNIHGHTYIAELEFSFNSLESIGYAIDFKEIKRVGLQWIDDELDHGMILNPHDHILIKATEDLQGKMWLMSLNGPNEYCNPSAENIAKEVFLAMEVLFESYNSLKVFNILLHETPNCAVTCSMNSISFKERQNWRKSNYQKVKQYAIDKGILEYDDRK